ncbi:hypothetical protein ACHAWF_009858 [Thalassiosira exigua]
MTVNVFSPTADGIIAALLAPLFMSLGFFIWDQRWTASGASAFALNMYKCNAASIGFVVMCLVRGFASSTEGSSFPAHNVGFLVLSSALGIIVGDILWLEALRLLGAKHVIVIDSLKPFAAAILGRLALEEELMAPAWGGMVLTVVGVGAVAWEEHRSSEPDGPREEKDIAQTGATDRTGFNNEEEGAINLDGSMPDIDGANKGTIPGVSCRTKEEDAPSDAATDDSNARQKRYKRGYFCAIINVLADSFGSLLTRIYGVGMTTWSINLIRFGFAGVVLACISIGMRLHLQCRPLKESAEPEREADAQARPQWFELPTLTRMGWLQITAGVLFVTFLCPALSNYALFQIALGLAVSLGSVGPLYGLLLDWPFRGRRPTWLGCLGVLLSIAGVVILCVWGTR